MHTGLIEHTEEDEGCISVMPVSVELTLDGDLACDWRGGDVW
jgi:aminoglycoside 2'-N-acetyltransferase I